MFYAMFFLACVRDCRARASLYFALFLSFCKSVDFLQGVSLVLFMLPLYAVFLFFFPEALWAVGLLSLEVIRRGCFLEALGASIPRMWLPVPCGAASGCSCRAIIRGLASSRRGLVLSLVGSASGVVRSMPASGRFV